MAARLVKHTHQQKHPCSPLPRTRENALVWRVAMAWKLFSSSMYTFFLLLAALSLQKLHIAGALHHLFLVCSSLTNQHCTVAATQHTDLVIFILHSPVRRKLRIFNLFLVFTLKLSEGRSFFFSYVRVQYGFCATW